MTTLKRRLADRELPVTRRLTLLATLALTATATVSLSGCGGADDSADKSGDRASTADSGAERSASPSRSASEATGRPRLDLPSDLSYTFDWPKTGDKEKDAVLADSEQSIQAVDLAIVHQDALDHAYLSYYEGEAAAGTQKFIQNYVDHKASITGAYRFYDPDLAVNEDGTASLSYCEDQGKAFVKYLPDKVKKTRVTSDSYVMYHTSLKQNDKGVWEVREILSQIGSAKCQP
ncbi:hypothetical protein ABZT03_23025 [Streptomyces sp. NPDC005574]|uniref:hypothetical protein n=1 Tax=Streptomyces sp. NPDC005574 TaxID=3156891 RepID=UPI0033A72E71